MQKWGVGLNLNLYPSYFWSHLGHSVLTDTLVSSTTPQFGPQFVVKLSPHLAHGSSHRVGEAPGPMTKKYILCHCHQCDIQLALTTPCASGLKETVHLQKICIF